MYYSTDSLGLAAFTDLIARKLSRDEVPLSAEQINNIPVYDVPALDLCDPDARRAVLSEWAWVLGQGPGVLALRGAVRDHDALDQANAVFERIIAAEKQAEGGGGDHFAAAGLNDRIWNSLQKLCLAAPDLHARIFGAPALSAVSEAWLGPHFQMTAQVNLVHPGGQPQEAHRDYHLGFASADTAAQFPGHVHDLTAALTLQGAVAHCDMPLESGPTQLLPYSQLHGPGYLAYRDPTFRALFKDRFVQAPLAKGDALFFNPALFHAAGENRSTDIHRMANLLQVSSAFGRAMETLDRTAMCKALYPHLADLDPAQAASAIACTAEGYAFPTSLDNDPPMGGLSPKTQADLMRAALANGDSLATLAAALDALDTRRQP